MYKVLVSSLTLLLFLSGCGNVESDQNQAETEEAIVQESEPPVIEGMKEGETIEIEYLDEFNLKDYLKDHITIKDDLDGDIKEYLIKYNGVKDNLSNGQYNDFYNPVSGEITPKRFGIHNFTVTAKDNDGNKSDLNFNLKVNRFKITKENYKDLILEMDEVKITVEDIRFGYDYGQPQYLFDFFVENNSDEAINVFLTETYINDILVDTYTINPLAIAPGKKGYAHCGINVEDLKEGMTDFDYIESSIVIDPLGYGRPIIIDADFFN